jgi:hypothetical protein
MHSQAGGSAILNTPSGVVQEEAGEVLSMCVTQKESLASPSPSKILIFPRTQLQY